MNILNIFRKKPEIIPDPTVQLQKRVKTGWQNIEQTKGKGQYRTVTTDHKGMVEINELKI